MSESVPTFSDEESALILQRAGELQAEQGRNLSLTELEAAAAEAGIDSALVLRAAQEIATAERSPQLPAPRFGGLLGAPLHVVVERSVLGEGTCAYDDEMIEIRRQLGLTGRVELIGRNLSWRTTRGRKIRVCIVPRGGRRLIRVEERMSELGSGLFLGMGLPVTLAGLGFILPICIAVLELPVLIPMAFVAWATMAFLLARTIFRSVVRQREPELRALADGLVEVCEQAPLALPDQR